jgi:hypothetical protein
MTTPTVYPVIDWKNNEYHQLGEALKLLEQIQLRETKRHQMDMHLNMQTYCVLEEVIGMLQDELDHDPTPNELGEPPITADEMHTAAWKEHQEMHA